MPFPLCEGGNPLCGMLQYQEAWYAVYPSKLTNAAESDGDLRHVVLNSLSRYCYVLLDGLHCLLGSFVPGLQGMHTICVLVPT